MADISETIKEIGGQLSSIFRYLLPGLLIIGEAFIAYPRWFKSNFNIQNNNDILIILLIAVIVGNNWYILHRYTIHQLLDWLIYELVDKRQIKLVKLLLKLLDDYLISRSSHIYDFYNSKDKLRDFLHFRSSQIILMFILVEVTLLFSIWHEPSNYFECHKDALRIASFFVLIFALIQYYISNRLDKMIVEQWKKLERFY